MLGAHGLLQPNCSDETACYFNSTLESRKEIEKFVSKLQRKHLRLRDVRGQTFFRSPFDLFAALYDGSRGDAKRISRDLKNFILRFPSWNDLLPELGFLEIHQKVLLYFVSHPDLVILSGLCLALLAVMFKTPLKLYQMYQRKSLVTFEVAAGLDTGAQAPQARIGVFLFGDAISFSILDKSKTLSPIPSMDRLIEDLRTNNSKFKAEFSRIEIEIMQTLVENMGPFSQLLLNFADYSQRAQHVQHERDELISILNAIREDMAIEKQDFPSDKVLRIESMELGGLSPAVKAELIFGKRVVNEPLNRASQVVVNAGDRPPGLKERYSDSIPTFSMPTLDLFERVDSLNGPGNEQQKRTPETGETINRKHSFEGMNIILEHAEEHGQMGASANSKQLKTAERFGGSLKFFNEKGEFGFFLKDLDKSDVFVHLSELKQAGISLKTLTDNKNAKVTFAEVEYTGKNNKKAKKAVDIQFVD